MSRANGQLVICDRCGAQVFLKCTGEGETDGGYTRWNTFEPCPGWDFITRVGTVCPTCRVDYENMLERFKKRPPQVKGD